MKDLFDAITTRIQAPYFGYSLLAFVVLNWRALFLLIMLDATAHERISIFEQETSVWSVVVLPLLVGAILAIFTPWSRYIFEYLSQKPFALRDRIHLHADHQRTIQQTKLEQARSELFGQKEQELIERAKRDEEIAGIDDEDVKARLTNELATLRAERDKLASQMNSMGATLNADVLSGEAVKIIEAAAATKSGTILTSKSLSGRSIKAGNSVFGDKDAKSYALYESALEDLETMGYVKPQGPKREIFGLTHKGWRFAENR
ncbi:hypothetical protein [Corallibacter sp.]|uniref:hypothetical protein n=1 Tax=Corallibacter sp. TaxID=2038084 RepID=UPI003AB1522E